MHFRKKEVITILAELVGIAILGAAAYLKGNEIKGKIDECEGDSFAEKSSNFINGKNEEFQKKYDYYREKAERDYEDYGLERVNEKGKDAVSERNMAKARAYSDVYKEHRGE